MVGLNSIITTVMLLPICECPNSGNPELKPLIIFSRYNTTNQRRLNPDRRQISLRLRHSSKEQEKDLTVIASSFDLGMSALAVAAAVSEQDKFPQLDPTLAYYHTSAYRWILRQLSLYPDLFFNKIFETHKVWRRRFYYEDALVPQWLRKSLVWVNSATWDKEENVLQKFNIYSRRNFDEYARYPPKKFISNETFSNSSSIYYPGPFDDKS